MFLKNYFMLFLTGAGFDQPLLPQEFCKYLGKNDPAWKMPFINSGGI